LQNQAAADIQQALTSFYTSSLAVYTDAAFNTAYQQFTREVIVVPEPVSNSILISATPRYFAEISGIIAKLDSQPPQVVIEVMIAQVQLNTDEEFGIEPSYQSPVIFQRGFTPNGSTQFTATSAIPGFNFNTTNPLPTSNIAASPDSVGYQSLGNFGT